MTFAAMSRKGRLLNRLRYLGRFFAELWLFAKQNRVWWIVPTVIVLLILGVLIVAGQSVAPFIYTLF